MTREDAGLEGPVPDRYGEALAKQQQIFRDTFPGMLGVRVLEVSDGFAKATVEVGNRMKHPGGSAHGGALAGFGDTCAAWATFPSLADGEIFTTIEFKANFISGVTGGFLIGEARAIHRGRRTMLIEVKISTDEPEPRLVCVMLVTQAILQPRSADEPSRY